MNEEEVIKEFKNLIYNSDFDYIKLIDEDGFTGWHELFENILDLYNKEKEKNKEYENKIKAVLELIDTKPYTAYTFYGDILYDDENIRELLEERN